MAIRVLIANRPRLLRELVMATISDQPDIEIVGESEQESEIENMVETTRPDFLIVASDKSNHLPAVCLLVLQKFPQLGVIAIAPDGNNLVFYWASLQIQSNWIEASEAGVLSALRSKREPSGRVQ